MPRNKPKKDTSERWMISYADLLTLMLAFFIVLYSQSMNNVSRLREIARGMTVAFNGSAEVIKQDSNGGSATSSGSGIFEHNRSPIKPPMDRPASAVARRMAHMPFSEDLRQRISALDATESELRDVLGPLLDDDQVSLARHPLSLRVRLNSKILFPTASADLTDTAEPLLVKIADVLNKLPDDYPLVIQGYTDKRPINTADFESNWQLSTARAVSVVQLFQNSGFLGKQLSAEGFSKYHPVKDGDNPKAMRANRRVEILIKAPSARSLDSSTDLSRMEAFTRYGQGQDATDNAQDATTAEADGAASTTEKDTDGKVEN